MTFTSWTTSLPHCGVIVYTAKNFATGLSLDSTLITPSFSSAPLSFATYTYDITKAGTLTVEIKGTTTSPGGVIASATATFVYTIVNPCPTATLNPAVASNTAITYYTNEAASTETLTTVTSTLPVLLCGAISYAAYSDTSLTAMDGTVFTFTASSLLFSV